jgi:hypothetical protein
MLNTMYRSSAYFLLIYSLLCQYLYFFYYNSKFTNTVLSILSFCFDSFEVLRRQSVLFKLKFIYSNRC